jgi:hypothetical protein
VKRPLFAQRALTLGAGRKRLTLRGRTPPGCALAWSPGRPERPAHRPPAASTCTVLRFARGRWEGCPLRWPFPARASGLRPSTSRHNTRLTCRWAHLVRTQSDTFRIPTRTRRSLGVSAERKSALSMPIVSSVFRQTSARLDDRRSARAESQSALSMPIVSSVFRQTSARLDDRRRCAPVEAR